MKKINIISTMIRNVRNNSVKVFEKSLAASGVSNHLAYSQEYLSGAAKGFFLENKYKDSLYLADNFFMKYSEKLILCKCLALAKRATCILATCLIVNSCSPIPAFSQSVDISIIERIESNGNNSALSNKGAYGAFQITRIALADFNKQNNTNIKFYQLRDKELSAHIAIWLLEVRAPQLLKEKDSIRNRLISYNCGASCVGKPLNRETKNYINHYKNKGGKL